MALTSACTFLETSKPMRFACMFEERKVSGVGEHAKHHDPSPKIVVHCHFSSLCKIGRESGHGALQHKN